MFSVEVSQNKHNDFMILKNEVNAYQAGNIKIVTNLSQKLLQIVIFFQ